MKSPKHIVSHTALALGLAAVAALGLPASSALAGGNSSKTDIRLVSTGVVPSAAGRAILRVRNSADGRFEVRLRGLTAATPYEVVVSGVRVSDALTDDQGSANVRLRSRPRSGKDQLLGFDPRGSVLVIRDEVGQDVLAGDLPAGGNASDDAKIVCCIPDDSGPECEDRTADECTAQGGTVSTATTCLPNPCDTTVIPTEDEVVCCEPDDSGPECEDRSVEECSARSGIVVAATDCSSDPCAAIPALDTFTRCCTADDSGNECEARLPSECLARGGVDIGAGTCSVEACAGISVPTGSEAIKVTCEVRSSRSKASVNGSGLRDGSYSVRLVSDASEVSTSAKAAVLGEAEFDFDSEPGFGNIVIDRDFVGGNPPTVGAQILDENGNVVVEGSAACRVR